MDTELWLFQKCLIITHCKVYHSLYIFGTNSYSTNIDVTEVCVTYSCHAGLYSGSTQTCLPAL